MRDSRSIALVQTLDILKIPSQVDGITNKWLPNATSWISVT